MSMLAEISWPLVFGGPQITDKMTAINPLMSGRLSSLRASINMLMIKTLTPIYAY